MSDKLPTIWDYEPHTKAKHQILQEYLNAWFPILSSMTKAKRALFVDGFAGPGEYSKGEEGSPVLAMLTALRHKAKFAVPVRLVFIEADRARHAHLCGVVERVQQAAGETSNLVDVKKPYNGECGQILGEALTAYEKRGERFGPALVFLDQFGYSDIPIELIQRILAHAQSEVFTYMHVDGMTRFLEHEPTHLAISRAFGSDAWKRALTVPQSNRARVLAEEYEQALRVRAGAKYVWRFAMHGSGNRLLYWLFFCTNSRRGLEVMKSAMLKVDTSGGYFSFSDARSPDQLMMFNRCDDKWLGDDLCRQFSGQSVETTDVEEYVITATPLITYKKTLAELERQNRLAVPLPPPGRKKGTFADPRMMLRFAPKDLLGP